MTGTYVSVVPMKSFLPTIVEAFGPTLRKKMLDPSAFHVTLMQSMDVIPEAAHKVDSLKKFEAYALGVSFFQRNSASGVLACELESTDLESRHYYWQKQGGTHPYPIYVPHLTLTSLIPVKTGQHFCKVYRNVMFRFVLWDEAINTNFTSRP